MEFISAKSILSARTENNQWFGTNYNMNLYKGCCHGCIYCDSRSECYRIENFDTVRAKENAIETLRRELSSKKKTGVVGSGSMSDPYNPFEEELKLTRQSLELLDRFRFGASMITKSALVTRDADLYKSIQAHSPVLVKITVTTPFDELSKKIEPRASTSSERLSAINTLAKQGIFCGILMMPILPFIEDDENAVKLLVKKAAASGARFIFTALGVTLRANQRLYFYERLDELFPEARQKYIGAFGDSYECGCPNHKRLFAAFADECERLGIIYRMEDIISAYKSGYGKDEQLTLF